MITKNKRCNLKNKIKALINEEPLPSATGHNKSKALNNFYYPEIKLREIRSYLLHDVS